MADLRNADLDDDTLTTARTINAILSNASLADADLSDSYLRNNDLSNANLYGAGLSDAYLIRDNLNADSNLTNLSETKFDCESVRTATATAYTSG